MAAMPPQPPGGGGQQPSRSGAPQPPAYPPSGPPQPPSYGPPQGGGTSGPGQQPAYAGAYGASSSYPAARVRRRTGWITLAQIIIIIEACLGMLLAIGAVAVGVLFIINGASIQSSLSGLPGYSTLPSNFANAAGGVFIGIGIVLLLISILWLILGVTVGRPSNVSRWIIVVLIILSLLGDIGGITSAANVSGTSHLYIGYIVKIVLDALVLFALLIDPASRRAFAGRP